MEVAARREELPERWSGARGDGNRAPAVKGQEIGTVSREGKRAGDEEDRRHR